VDEVFDLRPAAILRDLYLPEVLISLPWLSPGQFRVEDRP